MIGLLWFDNNPKSTLEDKIKEAVAHYIKKYHRKPNQCHVHPSIYKEIALEEIALIASKFVRPNHFYIIEEKEEIVDGIQ